MRDFCVCSSTVLLDFSFPAWLPLAWLCNESSPVLCTCSLHCPSAQTLVEPHALHTELSAHSHVQCSPSVWKRNVALLTKRLYFKHFFNLGDLLAPVSPCGPPRCCPGLFRTRCAPALGLVQLWRWAVCCLMRFWSCVVIVRVCSPCPEMWFLALPSS